MRLLSESTTIKHGDYYAIGSEKNPVTVLFGLSDFDVGKSRRRIALKAEKDWACIDAIKSTREGTLMVNVNIDTKRTKFFTESGDTTSLSEIVYRQNTVRCVVRARKWVYEGKEGVALDVLVLQGICSCSGGLELFDL